MGIWPTLNVSLDPEMKDRLLDQSIFRHACERCQHVAHVFFRMLYHDMDTHTMVWLVEPGADTDGIQHVLSSLPFGAQNYRLRIVRSINELVEMVLVIDAGLCDLSIQVVKFGIMSNEDAPEGPWYFNGIDSSRGQRMMGFSSPSAGVSCQIPLDQDFDELAATFARFDRSESWIEATPEYVLRLLEESMEGRH
jgi:hypothetical protein